MSRLRTLVALLLVAVTPAFAGSVSAPMNVSVQVVASARIRTVAPPRDQRTKVPVLTVRSSGPAPRTTITPAAVSINF